MDKETYFTMAELKTRGWTATLIRDLLADPDATRNNPRYASAAPMRLYLRERVLAVEQSDEWAALAAAAATRRDAAGKAAQTKKERLLAYVDALAIDVPVIPMIEATRLACDDYNDFKGAVALERGDFDFRTATPESDPPFLTRITVNQLRHRLTHYDRELDRLSGKTGVHEAYSALNQKVYAAIAAAYPELSEECHRQAERKRCEIAAA